MQFICTIVLLFVSSCLLAQIPNNSFEIGTESAINDWKTTDGKSGVYATYAIKANTGDSILKPENGNKFGVLEKGTAGQGQIWAKFPFDKRSAEFSGKFMYLANNPAQRFSVEITYFVWNSTTSSSDTLMNIVEKINPFSGQKIKNFDWFFLAIPIEKYDFRLNGNPDSCAITITLDDGKASDSDTKLFIDDLKFSTEIVAGFTDLGTIGISVFPNPSNGSVFIQGLEVGDEWQVYNYSAQLIMENKGLVSTSFQLALPRGIYILKHTRKGTSLYHRILVL